MEEKGKKNGNKAQKVSEPHGAGEHLPEKVNWEGKEEGWERED